MWNHYGSETYSISVTQRSENLLRITHRTRPIMLCIPRLRELTEFMVKFIRSEKARKFGAIFRMVLMLLSNSKPWGRLCQIFVAFTENLNFSSKDTYRRVSNIEFLSIEREKIKDWCTLIQTKGSNVLLLCLVRILCSSN